MPLRLLFPSLLPKPASPGSLQGALFPAAVDEHLDDEGECAQINDGGDDDIGDVFVVGGEVCNLQTGDIQCGHEAPSEDHSHGVIRCQQGHWYAVETRTRQGLIGRPEKFCVAREVVQRRPSSGQCAGNGHGEDDVPLVLDTSIAGGVAVGSAGFQLIAQGGFVHDNVHEHSDQNSDQDAHVDLGIGKDFIQTHFRRRHTVECRFVDVAGFGVFCDILEVADIEEPGHEIGGQPVGHDAGQNLVDIQEGFQQSWDSPPNGPGSTAAQKCDKPNQCRRHRFRGDAQRQHQGDHGTHEVLSRGADVEQSRLEGHRHRETRQNQWGPAEEHIPNVGWVETKGQVSSGIASSAEQTAKD